MSEKVPASIPEAIYALQNPSLPFPSRLNALRYLYVSITSEDAATAIPVTTRMKINQLLLESIMGLVVAEQSSDLRQRQMLRTECFLMLARLLETKSLFDRGASSTSEHQSTLTLPEAPILSPPKPPAIRTSKSANASRVEAAVPPPLQHSTSAVALPSSTEHSYLLASALTKPTRTLKKHLQPRTSVLTSIAKPERIVPGVDPYNTSLIDQKLGYSKPRMWFPAPPAISGSLVPSQASAADDYMQMKALLSYVGDIIMPGASSIIDPKRYESAVQEAVHFWTPLLGKNLPQWMQHGAKTLNFSTQRKLLTMAKPATSQEEPIRTSAAPLEKTILFTRGTMRKLLRSELTVAKDSKTLLRETLDMVLKNEKGLSSTTVADMQNRLLKTYAAEHQRSVASVNALQSLINETIQLSYSALPPRYLVAVEGSANRSRDKIYDMMVVFATTRLRNFLRKGFDIWKILLLQRRSEVNRIKYCKIASMHLLHGWLQNRKVRRVRMWLNRWRINVSRDLFCERNNAVLPIQCLYRRWRDRKRFIQLHLAGPYNGPLSDIYLAKKRIMVDKFFIPPVIRHTRRMLWQAALLIQTQFRRYNIQKEFLFRIRKLILIQSFMRMIPKYIQYNRLRFYTIRMQAYMRRTLYRRRYKILKKATIVVQKYTRRYLGILLKWRLFEDKWTEIERPMAAAIRIQCRWRIYFAKKRVFTIKFDQGRQQWAALMLQRNWYRIKKSYHTFVLMCSYRVREIEDRNLDILATQMGRFYAARKLQRIYKLHYFKRIVSSVVKLQCWYRGKLGCLYVTVLRRRMWASRKLHHWARGMMKKKHARVRRIQRVWWLAKPGRLLRHLDYVARKMDERADQLEAKRQYDGAVTLQAVMHGVFCRRWVKRHRAALKIQKPLRFFLARKRWKRELIERSRRVIRKVVGNLVGRGLILATNRLYKLHNAMIVKPQALIRGFIVRSIISRVKSFAYKFGLAVIRIQRFWRKSGAFMKAVQEVLALKRLDNNPYKDCPTLHSILFSLQDNIRKYYHVYDPRIGLLCSGFLQRLGLLYLLPMFPAKYKFVSDMKSLTMERLLIMHKKYQQKLTDKATKEGTKYKPVAPPKTAFQEILNMLEPPLPSYDHPLLKNIVALQEVMSMDEFENYVVVTFNKRFGAQYTSRADNLAKALRTKYWTNYNNYKSLGAVSTLQHIIKAIATAKTPSEVRTLIEEYNGAILTDADRKWESERVKQCAESLQLAVDMALMILPEDGVLHENLHKLSLFVSSFRRRFLFMINKMKTKKPSRQDARKKEEKPSTPAAPLLTIDDMSSTAMSIDNISIETGSTTVATAQQSVDRAFYGLEEDAEAELNIGICKLYMELLYKYYIATRGVQSIKNHWSNKTLKRAMIRERQLIFLEKRKEEYYSYRHDDQVQLTWKKLRRREIIQWKMDAINAKRAERLYNMDLTLQWLPRQGWIADADPNGYTYYRHEKNLFPSTYDMPAYTRAEFEAAEVIQYQARKYLVVVMESRRIREEQRQREMEHQEQLMLEMYKNARHTVSVKLDIGKFNLSQLITTAVPPPIFHSPESMLPYRYRFLQDYKVFDWVLYKQNNIHINAIVLKLKPDKRKANIRLASNGEILRNIDYEHILFANLDIGSIIEARYKGQQNFYPGKIISVLEIDNAKVYNILYDDGEKEFKVKRELIRLSQKGMAQFFAERNRLLNSFYQKQQRVEYYAKMKHERLSSVRKKFAEESEKFAVAWHNAVDGSKLGPGENLRRMVEASSALSSVQYFIATRAQYTKAALRYGWHEIKLNKEEAVYRNYNLNEEQTIPPLYSSTEIFYVKKIQAMYSVYRLRKALKKLLTSSSLTAIIYNALARYQAEAYVGYALEGVTPLQLIYRSGYWELGAAMESYFKIRSAAYQSLTVPSLVTLPVEKYSTIGITRNVDVKAMQRFQDWFNKTDDSTKLTQLSFLNYYTDQNDKRTIAECIKQSETLLTQKITKAFRNSPSRVSNIVKAIIQSPFPITRMQLDTFLTTYAGKAGLAQENVSELVNKPTVPNWKEEKEAYFVLKGASRRLLTIFKTLKIKYLYTIVSSAEKRAEEMIASVAGVNDRADTSGPEAKAALLLRKEVFDYVLLCEKVSVGIQKRLRGITCRLRWLRIVNARQRGVVTIQRYYRGYLARKLAAVYREQQASDWEQLWHTKHQILYYYNRSTGVSVYDEPVGLFRPLVRDLRSAKLIQAWPHLDGSSGDTALSFANAMCSVCETRKAMRACHSCQQILGSSQPSLYCFSCYASEHSHDPELMDHEYSDIEQPAASTSLMCCECDAPATRKCLGVLDDQEIDVLCSRLQRATSASWMKILQQANVGGERKLTMMMERIISGSTDGVYLSTSQLQQIRTMLERTRAECDECYCTSCYIEVHSGGKRSSHRWLGFQPHCPVCSVCLRSPAERECADCGGSQFCIACFKVFHSKGRKRKHTNSVISEDISYGQVPCKICSRRVATEFCQFCSMPNCDSCYECSHKKRCDKNKPQYTTEKKYACVVCGEEADQRCVQCGDLYCSRTWMGNPGCFASYHNKGNRLTHITMSLYDDDLARSQSMPAKDKMKSSTPGTSGKHTPGTPNASRSFQESY